MSKCRTFVLLSPSYLEGLLPFLDQVSGEQESQAACASATRPPSIGPTGCDGGMPRQNTARAPERGVAPPSPLGDVGSGAAALSSAPKGGPREDKPNAPPETSPGSLPRASGAPITSRRALSPRRGASRLGEAEHVPTSPCRMTVGSIPREGRGSAEALWRRERPA